MLRTAWQLVSDLGSPAPTQAQLRRAERHALAVQRVGAWSNVYRCAMDQRVLTHLIDNLPGIGFSAEDVTMPMSVFRSTQPLPQVIAAARGPAGPRDRISFARIRALLNSHAAELRTELDALHDLLGPDGFLQLKGLALAMRVPGYDRHAFDLDVVIPDLQGQRAVYGTFSRDRGYQFFRCLLYFRDPPSGWARAYLRKRCPSGNWVVIDVLAGTPPCASPSLPNPIMTVGDSPPSPIWRRRQHVTSAGRGFAIPSDEDLLLLTALQAANYGYFQLRTFIDAAELLRHAGCSLDWDYVIGSARSARNEGPLRHLLEQVATRYNVGCVPRDVLQGLTTTAAERCLIRWGERRMKRSAIEETALPLLFQLRHYRAKVGLLRSPFAMLRSWWQFHLLRLAVWLAKRRLHKHWWSSHQRHLQGLIRFGSRVRPNFGSVCELLPGRRRVAAGCDDCLSKAGPDAGSHVPLRFISESERLVLEQVAEIVGQPDHECDNFRFYFSSRA